MNIAKKNKTCEREKKQKYLKGGGNALVMGWRGREGNLVRLFKNKRMDQRGKRNPRNR